MPLLAGLTVFLNAGLLFWLEPLHAKRLLPLWGGSPAVWNTCLVFYQTVLLAGYSYALYVSKRLNSTAQVTVHAAVMLLAILFLAGSSNAPVAPPVGLAPMIGLLAALFATVGAPFFALSANGLLLQRWFARLPISEARDPYFLNSAGNIGALAALLAFPLILERRFTLSAQSHAWSMGFVIVALLSIPLAFSAMAAPAACAASSASRLPRTSIAFARRLKWAAIACVSTSLMMGVTTYITTDIAPLPLLWVLPLSIYLLTYALAFAKNPRVCDAILGLFTHKIEPGSKFLWLALALGLPALGLLCWLWRSSSWWVMGAHLIIFFAAALRCHSLLAQDRPSSEHLEEFYLWIGLGGAAGGFLSALAAPLIFTSILEYPVAMAFFCMLLPARDRDNRLSAPDIAAPLALGFLAAAPILVFKLLGRLPHSNLRLCLVIPGLACLIFARRPARFGLGIMALILAGALYPEGAGPIVHSQRSFYGVHRIFLDTQHNRLWLSHGAVVHGGQNMNPALAQVPLAYYHPLGPAGEFFSVAQRLHPADAVAVVGLGVGSMIAYGLKTQRWTFYEIDPVVVNMASSGKHFTFLKESRAQYRVALGDARLRLAESADGEFGVLVIDAFSSDSIPLHLLTREAMGLYLSKLSSPGLLVFHITNRFMNLAPVLGDLARDFGLQALEQVDPNDEAGLAAGKYVSHWVVMAREKRSLGGMMRDPRWTRLNDRGKPSWSDDFSNLMDLL